jgi:hypothetical protein
MNRLKRFVQLTGSERLLLIRVAIVVGTIRVALWFLPADTVRRVSVRVARGTSGSVKQLVWAVETVSRYTPQATCLTQALAAQALLFQSGFPSQVEIGVAKDELRRLQTHAGVVCYGQVVLGGQHASHYNSVMIWNPQE